jgi:hypothetical protein
MNHNEILTHVMQVYQSFAEPERLYAMAGKYWRIMLSVGVLICILAVGGGGYMLVMTFFNMNASGSQGGAPQTLNRKELTRVVNGLSARQALFGEILATPPTIADPAR